MNGNNKKKVVCLFKDGENVWRCHKLLPGSARDESDTGR